MKSSENYDGKHSKKPFSNCVFKLTFSCLIPKKELQFAASKSGINFVYKILKILFSRRKKNAIHKLCVRCAYDQVSYIYVNEWFVNDECEKKQRFEHFTSSFFFVLLSNSVSKARRVCAGYARTCQVVKCGILFKQMNRINHILWTTYVFYKQVYII